MINNYIKKFKYYIRLKMIADDKYTQYKFKKIFGYALDLKNVKTLNEKIQWLKIYDRTDLHTKCADKFKVREYIKEKIGEKYLIPLIFETFKPSDINYNNLPSYPVIAKTNHARGVTIIKDKNKVDFKHIQKKLKYELNYNFYARTREWQYKNIVPRIIVEKLLLDKNGNLPLDYKFHCINGKVEIIQIDTDRFEERTKTLYDTAWNQLEFTWGDYPAIKIKKPKLLKEMIKIAEILAKEFCYVRVDLYQINNHIYFGELTFHPAGGFAKINPYSIDVELGNKLLLPN